VDSDAGKAIEKKLDAVLVKNKLDKGVKYESRTAL
jgi:hypothetical protein